MRFLKLFGLAALAVTAAMAFAGAGTAAAEVTVLCTENATPCPEAKIPTQGHHLLHDGTKIRAIAQEKPILKTYKTNEQKEIENEVECAREKEEGKEKQFSEVEGWYNEKGEQPTEKEPNLNPQHHGEITALKFVGCVIKGVSGSECHGGGGGSGKILGIQLPYLTLLSWTEVQNGQLIVYEQKEKGQPGATLECTVFGIPVLNCTYKVAENNSQVSGEQNVGNFKVEEAKEPEPGKFIPMKIIANQVELKFSGSNCKGAQKAKWDAKYEVVEPNEGKLWVSKQSP